MKNLFLLSTFLILAFSNCANDTPANNSSVCNKDEVVSPNLISIIDLESKMQDSESIVIEVSKKEEFKKGHIPSARQVWRPDFRSKVKGGIKGMRCSAEELSTFLQSIGVKENSNLLLYDAKGGSDAMRLAWVLDYYGFQKYQVINGGKKAWLDHGKELEVQPKMVFPEKEYSYTGEINNSILATKEEVRKAIDDPATILIDTREDYEYNGQCFLKNDALFKYKNGAFARGCIQGAVHLNWSVLSDLENDHRIKCTKDMEYDLAQKGITRDKNIIVYCQSGSRSSHTAFILRKILGFPNVKNYDGSWIEWSYLSKEGKDFPIEVHTPLDAFNEEFDKNLAVLRGKKNISAEPKK